MHAWDVVAWALDGALHCTECADGSEPDTGYGPNPVFAVDEGPHGCCDTCGADLDE
jgi:hypothetical protein